MQFPFETVSPPHPGEYQQVALKSYIDSVGRGTCRKDMNLNGFISTKDTGCLCSKARMSVWFFELWPVFHNL